MRTVSDSPFCFWISVFVGSPHSFVYLAFIFNFDIRINVFLAGVRVQGLHGLLAGVGVYGRHVNIRGSGDTPYVYGVGRPLLLFGYRFLWARHSPNLFFQALRATPNGKNIPEVFSALRPQLHLLSSPSLVPIPCVPWTLESGRSTVGQTQTHYWMLFETSC